jgi:hypothetical protein
MSRDERHRSTGKCGRAALPADGYASYAWRLLGLFRSEAGWLDLHDGRLRYSKPHEVVFDVPLEEVSGFTYPWYYFGGGVKLSAAGARFRFSFVLPNGAEYAEARGRAAAGDLAALSLVADKAKDIGAGRAVGRQWRRLLGGGAGIGGSDPAPG